MLKDAESTKWQIRECRETIFKERVCLCVLCLRVGMSTAHHAVGRCVKQTVALEILEENEGEEAGIEGTVNWSCMYQQHL